MTRLQRAFSTLLGLCVICAPSCGLDLRPAHSAAQQTATRAELLAQLDQLGGGIAGELPGAMRAMLEAGPGRYVSMASAKGPADLSGNVGGDVFPYALTWTYSNPGDLDQNSQVNISDLSALGANLGKSISSPDWDKARVADGDGNGEVNISDVTSIGANLLRTVTAYRVEFSTSGDGGWIELGMEPFAAAQPGGPKRFEFELASADYGFYRVVATDGASDGPASNTYAVPDPKVPPVTGLQATQGTLSGVVHLAWEQHPSIAPGEMAYSILRDGALIAEGVADLEYSDTQVVAGQHYMYSVFVSEFSGTYSDPCDPVEGWAGADNVAPDVQSVSPQGGYSGQQLGFSASLAGGAPDSYAWDFGGGASPNTSVASTPVVTLGAAGVYSARLTASNGFGADVFNFVLTVTSPVDPCGTLLAVPAAIASSGELHIIYADPLIRRNPRVDVDLVNGNVAPLDASGYGDILRTGGCEFDVEVSSGVAYPRLTVVAGSDPGGIDAATAGLPVVVSERRMDRLIVSGSGLADGQYAFAAFNADDRPAGRGTFAVSAAPPAPAAIQGYGWGVNAFDHGAAALEGCDLSAHQVSGASVDTDAPDVVWFEALGGPPLGMEAVVAMDSGELPDMRWPLELRAAGLFGTAERCLYVHVLARGDFYSPGDPGSGNIALGNVYTLKLDDPATPGADYVFAPRMGAADLPQ